MATRPPPTTTTAPASPRYQTCLNTNFPSPATPTTGPSHREPPKPTAQRLVRPPNAQHRAPTLTTVLRRPRTDRSYGKLRPMLNPLLMRNTRGTPKGSARSPIRCGPGAWPLMRKTPLTYVTRPQRRNAKPFHDAPTDDFDERAANELPFPDDPDYQPDLPRASEADDTGDASAEDIDPHNSPAADRGPDRESPPADQDGLGDLDSHEREERHLSEITDQAVEKCREAEGRDADGNYGEQGLTPAMRRIEAQAEHGKLVPETEKYALKGHDRFKAKLEEMVRLRIR